MNAVPPEISAVKTAMSGFDRPWHIIGGWAVDAHMGRQTRSHHDVEITVFRGDQNALIRHVQQSARITWQSNHVWSDWTPQTHLAHPLHQMRVCFPDGFTFDVLLNDRDDENWVFRRDLLVRRNLAHFDMTRGAPYPPEILLLYKARDVFEKDQHDFRQLAPLLDEEQSNWLRNAIVIAYPECPWKDQL